MSRNGTQDALQPSMFGAVTNLATANFSLPGNQQFQVKNEGTAAVTLEVIPADDETETYVSTVFDPGWNVEVVRKIKLNTASLSLKWGF
jgi:hypothetical protein